MSGFIFSSRFKVCLSDRRLDGKLKTSVQFLNYGPETGRGFGRVLSIFEMSLMPGLQKGKGDLAVAFSRNGFLLSVKRGGIMSSRHKRDRMFSKRTKERLEIYFLIIQLFSVILAVIIQIWGKAM
jgi:hypothetical protein